MAKECNDDEIKKAYKKQALKWHPDKHSNSDEEAKNLADKMFKDIGEAYAVLSDPKKKSRYDQGADIDELDHDFGSNFHGNPNDIFQMFFSGGGGGASPFMFNTGGSRGGGPQRGPEGASYSYRF